ncbi:MAG TPA: tail fiber protein [Solirubrobacterales bacterium]|nr:tail fiber protein [Solirubrobacterales bacterium]
MKRWIRKPRHATVVAYLALFLALGGSAYAVDGSQAGSSTVAACYDKKNGDLRILTGPRCKPGERPVTWNVEGPQGQAGPEGKSGSQGETGPQGPEGQKGEEGPMGPEGPKGQEGQKGQKGDTGATGTVDTSNFYDKSESDGRYYSKTESDGRYYDKTEGDARYLAKSGTAANSSLLGNAPPSSYVSASSFGSLANVINHEGTALASCYLGEIVLYAGGLIPSNLHLADGSLITLNNSTSALFSLFGVDFGGNGVTNFALPDLRSVEPKGAGPAGVGYYVCMSGTYP